MSHKKLADILRTVILSLILSTAIGYSFAAWVAPSAAPPNGNPPPPINVGDSPQVRNGNLYLNNWLIVKKAQSIDSTVAADGPKILTTKDYVVARKPGSGTIVKGYPCFGGGVAGNAANNVIDCDEPAPGEPTVLRKLATWHGTTATTPDAKIAQWNAKIVEAGTLLPGSFGTWLSNNPGKCTFIIPSNPTTGRFDLVVEPSGGTAERTLRLQFCGKWIGRAMVEKYYASNPPRPAGANATVSQVGSCFRQNGCNGDDIEDEGGSWIVTTIF